MVLARPTCRILGGSIDFNPHDSLTWVPFGIRGMLSMGAGGLYLHHSTMEFFTLNISRAKVSAFTQLRP